MTKAVHLPAFGLLAFGLLSSAWAETYETPPTFKSSDILPAALRAGKGYQVAAKVRNDGKMNHYTIQSKFGSMTADSTAELKIRLDELGALAVMQRVRETDQFQRYVVQGGKDTVAGAKSLVTNPIGTLTSAVTGIGKLAERAGDALLGDPPSDAEDSRLENAIGFSSTKRDYAAEFHVDPYSTNPLLQQRLNEIAWYGYGGKITASALASAIPGGVGTAVSVAKSSDWLEGIPVQMPPSELRKQNRRKLDDMRVPSDVSDLFLGNTVYSPVQQTKLVRALATMNGTADRGAFVKFAVLARSGEVAFFRARQAAMYANLHRKGSTVERFESVGTNAAARLADGGVTFCFPLDYLVWTEENAALAQALDRQVNALPNVRDKQIRLAGGISPLAKKALERMAWKVLEHVE